MTQRRAIRAALASACVFLCPGVAGAQAVPLEEAHVAGQVLIANPGVGLQITTFGTFPLGGPQGDLLFTAAGTPAPFLSAEATMAPFFFGSSSGILAYQMQVVGPAGDVPVSISFAGGVSGTSELLGEDTFAGFAMTALWRFATTSGVPLFAEEGISTPFLTGAFSQSFGGTHDLVLTANQAYVVTLLVNVGARGGSASAFIDPIFSFGPGVGAEYSFLFSEGIGNGPVAVPEPQTYLLLGAGLLLMRALSRVQRARGDAGGRARSGLHAA